MKTKKILIAFFSVAMLCFFVVQYGCKKEKPDPEPQPTDELIVSEDVLEIDTTQTGIPVIVGNNYTFTDNGNLPEFKEGDIIVGNSGYGYMRKVTSISTQGDDIVLTTSQATLEEVIENCNIQDEIQLTLDKAIYKGKEYPAKVVFIAKGASISEKGSINLSGFQIFSGTYAGVNVAAQIDQGSINFEPILTREIEIRMFKLKHLRLSSGGDLDFTCDASIVVDGPVILEKEKLVAQFYFGPFPFGPVPVFIVLSFNAGINTNLDITGSIGSGFDTEAYLEYGADYTDSQWSTIWEKSFESNSHGVSWDLSGETDTKVYVSPEVGLLVAGVAGPYMEAVPYLGFDGNINSGNQTWDWDLSAGAEGNIGFIVQIFGITIANYSTTLANWEAIIAQDNGELGSNNSPTAIFTVSPSGGTTSTTFVFDASDSYDNEDPTSQLQVRWDFDGNGSWDTGWDYDKTENHQYGSEATYTAKLEVKDTEGEIDETTQNVSVSGGNNTPPTAIFTVSPSSGTTSTTFAFDASGSYDNEDPASQLQVRWDFDGNGSWDTSWDYDKTENHQYGSEATYTAKMEVKDTEGLTDQYTKSITVNNGGGSGTFTDPRDGQTYNTIEIGSQTWFAENLNYETTNSWWYDNSSANGDIYGRLYTWDAALTACPSGWHLPSDDEWCTLTQYIDPTVNCNATGYSGTDAGYKMKSTSGWYSNGNGSNAYGYSALPGGYRNNNGNFYYIEKYALFWSSPENGTYAWYRHLDYSYGKVYRNNLTQVYGFSVRCVKD